MADTLDEKRRGEAARRLLEQGLRPSNVNIQEEDAVRGGAVPPGDVEKPAGAAAKDLRPMGERKAPAGSAEERAEKEAERKRKAGTAGMTPEQKRRAGVR